MEAKRARNIIITLIILAIGIKLILYIGKNYMKGFEGIEISSFIDFMENFGNLFSYLCIALIFVVAIAYWVTKPESKEQKTNKEKI